MGVGPIIPDSSAHAGQTTGAHAAAAISYAGSTNLAATDVEAALDELDAEKIAAAVLTTDGDILTRSGGVPARTTRISLAEDTAFENRFAPSSANAPGRIVLISGQANETLTVSNCTATADTTNVALGARSHLLTMSGAVTATAALAPLSIGTLTAPKYTGAALMIYLTDASKVTSIDVELWQDVGGTKKQSMTFRSQIGAYGQSFANGWNLIRLPNDYRRATYLAGTGTDMSTIAGCRLVIVTNAATTMSIGYLAIETRPKASLLFINDGGYANFFNNADGYADLKARDIPATIAVDCTNLNGTTTITEARLAELAAENRNSISFHGYTTSVTASMTTTQVIDETVKAQQWLAARGYMGRMWRAAWMQNSATNSPATDPLVLANPMYSGGYEYVHMWPFSNPSHVQRTVLHGKTSSEIDDIFTAAERCRGVIVCYTHDVRSDPSAIDMSITEWDYFISKIDEGIAAGWLEGTTFELLMAQSGLVPQVGIDGTWTVNYPDRTGTLIRRQLI